jgi:hypothetical protein
MSKVKETQSLVSAAVDPLMGILGGMNTSGVTGLIFHSYIKSKFYFLIIQIFCTVFTVLTRKTIIAPRLINIFYKLECIRMYWNVSNKVDV